MTAMVASRCCTKPGQGKNAARLTAATLRLILPASYLAAYRACWRTMTNARPEFGSTQAVRPRYRQDAALVIANRVWLHIVAISYGWQGNVIGPVVAVVPRQAVRARHGECPPCGVIWRWAGDRGLGVRDFDARCPRCSRVLRACRVEPGKVRHADVLERAPRFGLSRLAERSAPPAPDAAVEALGGLPGGGA